MNYITINFKGVISERMWFLKKVTKLATIQKQLLFCTNKNTLEYFLQDIKTKKHFKMI